MKRTWKYAIAGVVGSAVGVAVYLWDKHNKVEEDNSTFTIDVDESIPDYHVTEARDAGRFAVEALYKDVVCPEHTAVVDVIEFSSQRIYGVELGDATYYVSVDNDGTKEMENLNITIGEPCCCCGE